MQRDSTESVRNAISQRITASRPDLISTYGLVAVMDEIAYVAGGFHGILLDEIGSSDVSCWVKDVEEGLQRSQNNT